MTFEFSVLKCICDRWWSANAKVMTECSWGSELFVTCCNCGDHISGCVPRLRNSDFGFCNRTRILKLISPPRNPSSWWISINKFRSEFHRFSFLPFDWKIRKWLCKTILMNSGLLFGNCECACKTVVLKKCLLNHVSHPPPHPPKQKERKGIQEQISPDDFQSNSPLIKICFILRKPPRLSP